MARPGCGSVEKPDFGGAEWLANLYWTKVLPDPGVFNCPSTYDTNECGIMLGSNGCPGGQRLDPHAVSYAALGHDSVPVWQKERKSPTAIYAASGSAIQDFFPPNEAMASDDTQEPINHGRKGHGSMQVLFFDSHVEYWTNEKVDLERGVGMRGTELVHLRN